MAQKQIDWEQRRYEIAKAALPVSQQKKAEMTKKAIEMGMIKDSEAWHESWNESICEMAIKLADEMIKQLKTWQQD